MVGAVWAQTHHGSHCGCQVVNITMINLFYKLHDLLSNKLRFIHTSAITRSHSQSLKTTRTARVHLFQ